MSNNFHARSIEAALEELKTSREGLATAAARDRQREFGFNELPEKRGPPAILVFLKQFKSVLVYILFVAAAISWWFGELLDVYVIVAVVALNAIIGFVQEYKAERAIAALKKLLVIQAKVLRSDEVVDLPARELVPGDIVMLEEGDCVPADARLIEAHHLRTSEASLTGESLPVEKQLAAVTPDIVLADRTNMVWMSTFVASGSGRAVVVATGHSTALGEIARSLETIETVPTHFEQKSAELARQMGIIAIGSAVVTFAVGYLVRGLAFVEIFLFSVATLVSAIPEGLPAVLSIVLAVGAYRMSQRRAIIRRLPITETLGVATTIITDKTGTLTENVLRVERVLLPDGTDVRVTGSGWQPQGEFWVNNKPVTALEHPVIDRLLHVGTLSNNARILKESDDGYRVVGDPTEAALIVLAQKAGLKRELLEEQEARLADLPFNSEHKYRASLVERRNHQTQRFVYALGAPEVLLARSSHFLSSEGAHPLSPEVRKNITAQIETLARGARRVIAFGFREAPAGTTDISGMLVEKLTFLGIVGMMDPPRAEVAEAVAKARQAGIRLIMATGDHAITAVAIGRLIGLVPSDAGNGKKLVLTEHDLAGLSDQEFARAVAETPIFARLTPLTKLKIAESLQARGEVVAMTGDGVNDAPALKRADIGIAMGVVGTDVARDASHLVLSDDNFATIVSAIEEGRIVFKNTRRTSYYLLTTNFAEVTTILTTLIAGFPLPLLPIHVLWLNLVTDGFNTVGLAVEPGHQDVLRDPPTPKDEPILSRSVIPFLILMTVIMVGLTLGAFRWFLPAGLATARTAAFVVMSLTQIFNVFNMRSLRFSVFRLGGKKNPVVLLTVLASLLLMGVVVYLPFLQRLFRFSPLPLSTVLLLALLASFILWAGEGYKALRYRYRPTAAS